MRGQCSWLRRMAEEENETQMINLMGRLLQQLEKAVGDKKALEVTISEYDIHHQRLLPLVGDGSREYTEPKIDEHEIKDGISDAKRP